MYLRSLALLMVSIPSMNPQADAQLGALRPVQLRCEARVDPVGIDALRPALSWKLEALDASRRGLLQVAYRILVSDDPERLGRGEGDLWDSGMVRSSATTAIEYAGAPLRSGTHCHWKLRVWDQDGGISEWSAPARWQSGLLDAAQWRAQWIGYDAPLARRPAPLALGDARWIWHASDPPLKAPAGWRHFRKLFHFPADVGIRSAELLISADNHLELSFNGEPIALLQVEAENWKRVSIVDLATRLRHGPNLLAAAVENEGEGTAGLIARLVVRTHEGAEFEVHSDASWRTAVDAAAGWKAPGFADAAWPPARELGPHGIKPWGELAVEPYFLPPPRYLRREFDAARPLRRATLYASALGIYELRLNGERLGDDWFTPGWTDYTKRVYYNTYDVTSQVRRGANAIAATLADGWYAGYVGYKPERHHYGDRIRLAVQLELEYADGSTALVTSDESWKAAEGPLREADFLMGEHYDARREMPGWDLPGFAEKGWQPVDVSADTGARLQAYPTQTVGVFERLAPRSITEPEPGVYVLDMGQNFAGVVALSAKGEAGRKITLRHAERLNPDGTVYTENLRAARATDVYICRGTGEIERWTPRFTFHGFQYVEVRGLAEPPGEGTILGLALGSRTPRVGHFECSDAVVNQLVRNIYWTQRMNFIDVPTDCPQRDERLGWTGDAQIYVRTAGMLCDVQAFFDKWLVDLADAQRADGQFPMVAPLKVAGADGGPGWADAGTICPWTIYELYGDRALLRRHYDGMRRFVEFCRKRCTGKLLPPKNFHCFGDWVNIGANTSKDVIFTAYFARSTELTARAAAALGETEDAERFSELCARIKRAFAEAYVREDGRIKGHTQCAYALALSFDLLAGERRQQAIGHLERLLAVRQGHLSTGFLGTKDLMLALTKVGREDLAYQLLHNDGFPSWGFSIKNGATSIWERWNGWTPEEGFATPGMNSFAHYAFGAVGEWIFATAGGIAPATPGFERVLIRPRPGGKLTWARASYDSVRGRIECSWERDGASLRLTVNIPPGTSAVIHVPTGDPERIREGGRAAVEAPGLRLLGVGTGEVRFAAQSGRYAFSVE